MYNSGDLLEVWPITFILELMTNVPVSVLSVPQG